MNGQDVEFIEDVAERLGEGVAGDLVIRATKHRIDKQLACGIHGTLFFDMLHRKSDYPTKRETDLDKPWFNKP